MNRKKWIKIWFYIVMIIPIVGGLNYLVDPYGMNNFFIIERLNSYKKSNTPFTFRVKTDIVINNQFDTLMLGTSRVGVMDPVVVEKYLGGRVFNFEVPASTTEIQYKIFLYTLKFNKIKNLVYGIDFMSFNESRTVEKNFQSFNELKEQIQNRERINNYDLYFNMDTFYDSITVLYKNIMRKKLIEERYLSTNGMRDYTNYIDDFKNGTLDLNKNLEESIRTYFRPKKGIYKEYKFSKKYLEYFKKIINYCQNNSIKIWVYIPPVYSKHFDMIESEGYFDEFEEFKKELVKITDYIDFTGHNQLTKNIDNYWDGSHLRREFTSVIMKNIFHNNLATSSLDVGVVVNKKNIESHLKSLKDSLPKE